MLTYFPTPYPGEWWYSVLCRYHVRSGNIKNSVTIRELYGGKVAAQGKLFPGADCATVVARIPNAILDLRQILIEHTLMPYYLRFYPKERKEEILSLLLKGKNVAMTSKELCSPDGTEGLKFCTQCYDEDVKQFGEPFWHREHQIPLMPICFCIGVGLKNWRSVFPDYLRCFFHCLRFHMTIQSRGILLPGWSLWQRC